MFLNESWLRERAFKFKLYKYFRVSFIEIHLRDATITLRLEFCNYTISASELGLRKLHNRICGA